MSLVDNAMEATYIMDKATSADGYGGYKETYTEGAEIMVAYSLDTSTQARVAQQQGVANRYTLTTRKNIVLKFPDVVKRARDGKLFRVTSDGNDNATPNSATLDIRQVEAEEWSLS